MNNFNQIIKSEKPVLVDFFATWCGPCQMLSPILKQVKDSLGNRVSILKIDVDKNQTVASQYQVRGVPTMILFQNGKPTYLFAASQGGKYETASGFIFKLK